MSPLTGIMRRYIKTYITLHVVEYNYCVILVFIIQRYISCYELRTKVYYTALSEVITFHHSDSILCLMPFLYHRSGSIHCKIRSRFCPFRLNVNDKFVSNDINDCES